MRRWIFAALVMLACATVARAQSDPQADSLSQYGITLPPEVTRVPEVARQIGALRREKCDRQAVFDLSTALQDQSYRREAANLLVGFSKTCGGYAEGVRQAINLLLDISDYQRAIELSSELIVMEPNGDNGYYLRGYSYEQLNECEPAIADYSSAIELFANKDKISSVAYESMSRCYERLGQYCEAIGPIEAWMAVNPANNDNDQSRAVVRRLAAMGKCAQSNKGAKEERIRRRGSEVILAEGEIDGIKGRFIIDTGASFVTVKKAFAEKAGIKIGGQKVRLNTANGPVDGYLTRAKKVKLRSLEAERVPLVIQIDEHGDFGEGVDGLIGMSFLSQFDIVMDSKTLRIRPRKGR